MKKKVALYARVSTDTQQTGLEAQIRVLKEYCTHNKIDDYELFADENVSGTKSSRPALDRMMAAVKSGEVADVVVYSFSRFARSTTHLLSALETFKKYDVNFVSLTEKIDTKSPLGLAVFTILGAIAQLERDLIAERVRNGLANARAKGIHIGRKKLRNSLLIRSLLKAGVTYREAAKIAVCSHGSIHAEKLEMKREEEAQKLKLEAEKLAFSQTSKEVSIFPQIQQTDLQTNVTTAAPAAQPETGENK